MDISGSILVEQEELAPWPIHQDAGSEASRNRQRSAVFRKKPPERRPQRRQEIELMERLHREAKTAKYADRTRAYMLRDRDTAALEERRAILEALKRANGQLRCQ